MCCARSSPKTPNTKAKKLLFFLTNVAAKTLVTCFVFRRVRVQISAPKPVILSVLSCSYIRFFQANTGNTALPLLAARRPPFTILPHHYLTVTLIFDAIQPKPMMFPPKAQQPQWATASSLLRIHDHTQRRTTVGRTPLDE